MAAKQSILIVEDNEAFALLVGHYLRTNLSGVHIEIEHSGRRAMQTISRLKPTVIVLDYYLEDQLLASTLLEKIKTEAHQPTTILFSGAESQREIDTAMEHGFDYYLPKNNESIYRLMTLAQQALAAAKPHHEAHHFTIRSTKKLWLLAIAAAALMMLLLLVTQMG